jgi:pyruvate kinase
MRAGMCALEQASRDQLAAIAPVYRASARNLLHFIALHRHHHAGLADQLHRFGLSSLAGSDPHVMASLDAVLTALAALQGEVPSATAPELTSADLMASHCSLLFGPSPTGPGIMVTLPAEAAQDDEATGLIHQLLGAGMTLARINCAHDDAWTWQELARRVRSRSAALGCPCRIAVDLAGPKLRTGALPSLEGVIRVRPARDRYGRLLEPALVLATHQPRCCPASPGAVVLPVEAESWQSFQPGECLFGADASGRHREFLVEAVEPWGLRLRADQGCRLVAGLRFLGGDQRQLVVAPLPAEPGALVLKPGDQLWLLGDAVVGGEEIPSIACSLPELIPLIGRGERVMFDDGKITAVVREPGRDRLLLQVTAARGGKARLRGDKGINFPDSTLHTPALTAKDIDDLEFAVVAGDIVNFSFVHSPADITALHRELHRHRRDDLAVVLKIETRQAYEGLPELLLEAMRYPAPLGVMIARGDLAVECGWEALAQIQHDILRLCAAAHVPCIWATQVLDELARHGLPTRAEITDAAIGAQAHALMLNKGPNITAAVRALRAITQGTRRASRSDRLVSCLAYRSNCPA